LPGENLNPCRTRTKYRYGMPRAERPAGSVGTGQAPAPRSLFATSVEVMRESY